MAPFALRRWGLPLLACLLIQNANAEAAWWKPTWKRSLAGCALLVVAGAGAHSFLLPGDPAALPSESLTRRVGTAEGATAGLFAPDELKARFVVTTRSGGPAEVVLLNKNWKQKWIASLITAKAKEQETDPERKARIKVGEEVRIQLESLELERATPDSDQVTLRLILGPQNLVLEKQVPLRDIESGDIIDVRFPPLETSSPEGDKVTASVGISLRLGSAPGSLEIIEAEGALSLSTRLGNEDDKETLTGLRAVRMSR